MSLRWKPTRLSLSLIAVLASTATFTACGDDDSKSSNAAESPPAESTAASGPEEGPAGAAEAGPAVDVALEYVKGTKGKADESKPSIGVGWVNQDKGTIGALVESTSSVRASIDFVNEELGGIDGSPLKLIECSAGAEASEGKKCATQFLNDDEVKVILFGQLGTGGDSFQSAIAPKGKALKPVIGQFPFLPAQFMTPNVYQVTGGAQGIQANITFAKKLDVKLMAQIWDNSPELTPFIEGYGAAVKANGIDVKVGRIPTAATNVTSAVVASGAQQAGLTQIAVNSPSQCIATMKAITQLGLQDKPILGTAVCLDPSVKKALGDFPKITYATPSLNPNVLDDAGDVNTFRYIINTYDKSGDPEKTAAGTYSVTTLSQVLLATRWMNAMGPDSVTTEGFADQAKAFDDRMFAGESGKFGTKPFTSIPGVGSKYYNYLGDGKWEDQNPGEFLNPPPPPAGQGGG